MTVTEFFNLYPDAPGVWQAGEKLYLRSAKAAAEAKARQLGTTPKWVTKPVPVAKPSETKKQVTDGAE